MIPIKKRIFKRGNANGCETLGATFLFIREMKAQTA